MKVGLILRVAGFPVRLACVVIWLPLASLCFPNQAKYFWREAGIFLKGWAEG